MAPYIPSHDESIMPIKLGSVIRTPFGSWKERGIIYDDNAVEVFNLLEMSEKEYEKEWKLGSKEMYDIINEASKRAGLLKHNEILAESVADYVSNAFPDYRGVVEIIDIGAGSGNSAVKIYDALSPEYKERVIITILDPAGKPLEEAAKKLSQKKAAFKVINSSDIELMFMDKKYDIMTGVASVHHHAKIPWEIYFTSLKNGGRIVIGDWHNGVWKDSAKVYKMLQRMDASDEALKNFEAAYRLNEMKTPMSQADMDITEFWNAYKDILNERGQPGRNTIFPQEGQRLSEDYANEMDHAGFKSIETMNILPGTELLALTAAQKRH